MDWFLVSTRASACLGVVVHSLPQCGSVGWLTLFFPRWERDSLSYISPARSIMRPSRCQGQSGTACGTLRDRAHIDVQFCVRRWLPGAFMPSVAVRLVVVEPLMAAVWPVRLAHAACLGAVSSAR